MMVLIHCKIKCFWYHLVTKGKSFIFIEKFFGLLSNPSYSAPLLPIRQQKPCSIYIPKTFEWNFSIFEQKHYLFWLLFRNYIFFHTTWVEGSEIWKGPYGNKMGPLERYMGSKHMVRSMTPKPSYRTTKTEWATVWYSGKSTMEIQATCFTLAKWPSFSGPEFLNLWN